MKFPRAAEAAMQSWTERTSSNGSDSEPLKTSHAEDYEFTYSQSAQVPHIPWYLTILELGLTDYVDYGFGGLNPE